MILFTLRLGLHGFTFKLYPKRPYANRDIVYIYNKSMILSTFNQYETLIEHLTFRNGEPSQARAPQKQELGFLQLWVAQVLQHSRDSTPTPQRFSKNLPYNHLFRWVCVNLLID